VEDVWDREDQLWTYLTGDWLKLKVESKDSVTRWPEKKKWAIIRKANVSADVTPLIRKQVKKGDIKRLLNQVVGLIISIGALSNHKSLFETLFLIRRWLARKLDYETLTYKEKIEERKSKYMNIN
jgi:hypothetical protein